MDLSSIDNFSSINRDQVLNALKRIIVHDLPGSPENTITSAAGIIYQNKHDYRRIEHALGQDEHFVKKFQLERYSILESLVIELDGVLDAQDLIVFLLDAYRNDMLTVAMSFWLRSLPLTRLNSPLMMSGTLLASTMFRGTR